MNISLRLEVKKSDAINIIRWLENKNITQYLNEDINSIYSLNRIIENGQSDLLTYYLNQDGRFFLIDEKDLGCIGFLNLFTIHQHHTYEIVIAIGEENNWGKQYGKEAIKMIMREAFLIWRIERLVAKVKKKNERSINMFEHLHFYKTKETESYFYYSINSNEYLKSLK